MAAKVLFPRNIKKWFLANLTFSVWPFTISIVQMFILTVGLAWSFAIANYLMQHGHNRLVAIWAALPVTLLAIAIAFFNVSEMGLLEFLAKKLRTHFFDTTTKYQVNVENFDMTDILIRKNKSQKQTKKIIFKTHKDLSLSNIDNKLKWWTIL